MIYLDTHCVAWLYAGRVDLFSAAGRELIESSELLISPMVVLELEYLFEIKRTSEPGRTAVDGLSREVGLRVCDLPFSEVIGRALEQGWTRDPFDRLIVGQAAVRDAPLMTKDSQLLEHYPRAVWPGGA